VKKRPPMLDTSDLTALADGSLAGRRLQRLEELLAHAPELRRELERQRRAVAAIRSVDVAAPTSLRARVESLARSSSPV
jgi:anti-sigma factor RsiW